MKLGSVFQSSHSVSREKASYWFLYAVFGSLLPIWGSAILLMYLGQWEKADPLFSHGEYFIYAASFLSPTLYTLHTWRVGITSVVTYFILLACAVLFAGTVARGAFQGADPINESFLEMSSYFCLVAAMLITYITKVRENIHSDTDLPAINRGGVDKLEHNVDELEV